MTGQRVGYALCGALVAGLSAPAMADTQAEMARELAALKAQVAAMQAQQDDNWLTERRAQEIKGLMQEVLADAETRSSLLAEGATAGIDDKGKIFLRSADGSFLANLNGQIQARYIWNNQDDRNPSGNGESVDGLQFRRVKVGISGYVGDPKITYQVQFAQNRGSNESQSIDALKVGYKFNDWVTLEAGYYKAPFLREELNSSSRLLTVDRASVTEAFTLDKSQQISVKGGNDMFRYNVGWMFNFRDNYTDFFGDFEGNANETISSQGGFAGRVDVKLMGSWNAMRDFNGWRNLEPTVLVGGAIAYFNMDGNDVNSPGAPLGIDDYTLWTVDASYQGEGLSIYAAYMGNQVDSSVPGGIDREQHALLVQGGYFVTDKLQPFVRWEWADDDFDATDDLQIVTVGANYYLRGHNAKFTADVVYKYDGSFTRASNTLQASPTSSGLGLLGFDDDEDQVAVRIQFQLLF